MAESENEQERPCLHCLMVELIDDFFAEYPPAPGGSDKVDTEEADEIIEAVAKTVAELTSRQDGIFRQYLIEQLMREIMKFDGEFRREDAAGSVAPERRHLLLVLNEPPAHGAATARQQPSPTHPPKPTGAR
jgi:hypothetical protein